MKLVGLLEDDTRTKLLHLQQFIIEQYLEGVVETEFDMMPSGDHSWAPKIPVLEVKVDLGYWKNVVRVIYKRGSDEYSFFLTLDAFTVMRCVNFDCECTDVEHFPYWFEGSLNDTDNWHTTLFDAFIKHHGIKKTPLNFSKADANKLIHYLLTTEVIVEHTSGRWLPSIEQLDGDERAKTHRPAWKAWNETPVTSGYTDAYIIWVKK